MNERVGLPAFAWRMICNTPEAITQKANKKPRLPSQVNSPMTNGIEIAAITATTAAIHKRLMTANRSEPFQLVQGPIPINTNKGAMMGTKTALK